MNDREAASERPYIRGVGLEDIDQADFKRGACSEQGEEKREHLVRAR